MIQLKKIVFIACLLICYSLSGQNTINPTSFKLKQSHPELYKKVNVGCYIKGDLNNLKSLCKQYEATYFKEVNGWHYIRVRPEKLVNFITNSDVKSIHIPTEIGTPLNDTMRVNNRINDIHTGKSPLSSSLTGNGVIIGFIDTGLDFNHDDFKNSDGSTRIISLWDQTLSSSSNSPQPYGYGQHWNSNEIESGLADAHNDVYGHGTTVAGTAAGNGLASGRHKGVAHETEIIVVEVNLETNFLTNVQDATEYIYHIADSLGKPCVINASVGTREGSHDGKDPTALFIDNLNKEKQGRIFVCSAGNDGGKSYHLKHESNFEDTIFTLFKPNPNRSWSNILSELGAPTCAPACYGDSNVDFLGYADTSNFNNVHMSISAFHNNRYVGSSDYINIPSYLNGDYQLDNFGNYFTTIKNTNNNTIGTVFMYASIINNDVYQFRFIVNPDSVENYTWGFHTTGNGTVNVWSDETNYLTSDIMKSSDSNFPFSIIPYNYKNPDSLQTIYSSFQCLPSVITVANYVNETGYINNLSNWVDVGGERGIIASTSSTGPTRNELIKPDIAASGQTTISSFPTYLLEYLEDEELGDGGLHYKNGGTSMSSPVVAGIAALYLEKCSQANYQNFKDDLIKSAYTDDYTGLVPNYSFGYGKVDGFQTLINSGTIDTITESSCNSFTWNSTTYNTSGNYTFTTLSNNNCDSSVVLDLTIHEGSLLDTSITACNEFEWNGELYTQSGNYSNTLENSNGCDSIINLELIINTSTSSFEQASNCESYNWNGSLLTESGNYSHTLESSNGCDSVVNLELTINTSTSSFEQASNCESYNWNGELYTQSGNYSNTLESSNGCDSIINLELTINTSTSSFEQASSCDSYNWNGSLLTESGNYSHTLENSNGCDSIVNLELIINLSSSSFEQASSCDSYNWNGIVYNQSGIYNFESTNDAGCLNIDTLDLTIYDDFIVDIEYFSCDEYEWNGTMYTESGNYSDTLETINGCDSIVNLELTINSSSFSFEQASSCDSYNWNGTLYTQTGSYTDTLVAINGCDSIINLELNIYLSTSTFIQASNCETYDWNGTTYNESGVYVDTNQSINGCDSLVFLNLTINKSYNDTINISACNSMVWDDSIYTSSGIYTNNYSSVNNCDSLVTIDFSVNNGLISPLKFDLTLDWYCLETYWTIKDDQDSIWYDEGPYDCLPLGGGNQANNIIISNINLAPNKCYIFELHDQYGDGMSANNYDTTLSNGEWILKDFSENTLLQGEGNFGNSISTEFFIESAIISNFELQENDDYKIKAQPNPFTKNTLITIEGPNSPFHIEIIDINGRIIYKSKEKENIFHIEMSDVSKGIYWLKIKNQPNLKPLKLVIE